MADSKGYITHYAYDYNGNLLNATDANSRTTLYLYNYKDKLTKISSQKLPMP